MTPEERRIKIKEILNGTPVGTGTKLRYQGEIKEFNVYKIPLDFLVYNVENGRISSLVKSYKREHGDLNMTVEADAKKVANFLYNSSEERNKRTIEDLKLNGQLEPGIITMDGVIVDGNRRASLLRRIAEDPSTEQAIKDKCSYFITRILPEDADEKEILRLETSYQMGSDGKVDYNPIEKYLHTRDMHDKGFSVQQICEYMGLDSIKTVNLNLEIMELIDQYLESYGYDGIYTRMPRGFEDDLLKLNTALKSVRGGKISWIPSDKLDEVENDLRLISFDFIRLDEKSASGFDFRAIASTSNQNFLNDENIWNSFVDAYYSIEQPEERDTEDVLQNANSDEDASRLLNQRDNAWKNAVKSSLLDAFNDSKNKLDNKKEKDKPAALLKKAINALVEVDPSTISNSPDSELLKTKAEEIRRLIDRIGEALNLQWDN